MASDKHLNGVPVFLEHFKIGVQFLYRAESIFR
jgi:hypothetical protein